MSDEKEAMAAALGSLLPPPALRETHPAIVVDQATNGDVGVQIPSGSPSATAKPVPLRNGLPGFSVKLKPGFPIAVGFDEGAEDKAYAGGYPQYPKGVSDPMPVDEVAFGGGTKPISRVDDTTGNGRLVFTQAPVGPGGIPSTLTIAYIDPAGVATPILTFPIPGPAVMLAQDPLLPNPLVAVVDLSGKITSGREEFKA
jgi:hypothetical protein